MRPRPRLRKTAKWAGVVVCAVIAGVWLTSRWYWLFWATNLGDPHYVRIGGGCLVRFESPKDAPSWEKHVLDNGWQLQHDEWLVQDWASWFRFERTQWHTVVQVPLWSLLLVFSIPTALLWRRDHILTKRARAGRCRKCGYDRSGLTPDAPCPECGAKPA